MRNALLSFLLFAPALALAEEKPAESPRAVHERMADAVRRDDFSAWRACFAPKTLRDEEAEFDDTRFVDPRWKDKLAAEQNEKRAREAGVTLEEAAKLTWSEFAEKKFHNRIVPEARARGPLTYLSTTRWKSGRTHNRIVELVGQDDVREQEWFVEVDGAWKLDFSTPFRQFPRGDLGDAAVSHWKKAVLDCNGWDLFQMYGPTIQAAYYRGWCTRLGELQEASEESRAEAAAELGIKPAEIDRLRPEDYVAKRLEAVLKAWLAELGNRGRIEATEAGDVLNDNETEGAPQPDWSKALARIAICDGEWRVIADFLDGERKELEKK